MKYNIGEVFLMKRRYNKLEKNDEVEIVDRIKKGKDAFLSVRNANDEFFIGVSPKLLKKKKKQRM